MAIASEQGRIYRATINGMISTADGARLTYQLREMRCTRESINAEAIQAAVNAPKPPPPPPTTVNILTIPSGTFVDEATMQRLNETADSFPRTPLIEYVELGPEPGVAREEPAAIAPEIAHERVSLDDYAERAAQQAANRELDEAIAAAAADHAISPEQARLLTEVSNLTKELMRTAAPVAKQAPEPPTPASLAYARLVREAAEERRTQGWAPLPPRRTQRPSS
jgi:hypothetical protein